MAAPNRLAASRRRRFGGRIPYSPSLRRGLLVLLAGMGLAPSVSALPALVRIGNAPSSQSGDYINTGDLAHTLAFTTVWIEAEQVVRIEDPSDVSVSSIFGPTIFGVILNAPARVEVLGDLTMGAGDVTLTAPEVRLEGVLRDTDGFELDQSRLASSATSFVVGSGGSVQQASLMASENPALPTTITVEGASDANLVNVWSNVLVDLRSGFVENLTLLAAGSQVDWRGGQIGATGLFGFGGTIRIHGSQFERGPYAVCSGLPPSSWSPAPATLTNVGACLRGRLASGETFLVVVNFGGTIQFIQEAPPAPVPGPGAWVVPILLPAGWLLQRRIARRRAAVDRASAPMS